MYLYICVFVICSLSVILICNSNKLYVCLRKSTITSQSFIWLCIIHSFEIAHIKQSYSNWIVAWVKDNTCFYIMYNQGNWNWRPTFFSSAPNLIKIRSSIRSSFFLSLRLVSLFLVFSKSNKLICTTLTKIIGIMHALKLTFDRWLVYHRSVRISSTIHYIEKCIILDPDAYAYSINYNVHIFFERGGVSVHILMFERCKYNICVDNSR